MQKNITRALSRVLLVSLSLFVACLVGVRAQDVCPRIMVQDSTGNNLVAPPGAEPVPVGTLGGVQEFGNGPQSVIFVPGLGFGGDVLRDYMLDHADEFTFHAVTLAGFDGTPAPEIPTDSVSFGEQTWTNGAIEAISKMIVSGRVTTPVIMGHWLTGTQIALRLALRFPEEVKAVILVSGSACFVATDTTQFPAHPPLDYRVSAIDDYMAPSWFKTVTRETWDDNNFLPVDYATNPIRGLRLWRVAAQPALYVWVRYLCEFYAQDISLELTDLKVPTLLMKPGLEGHWAEPGNDYLPSYCHTSWEASKSASDYLQSVTIPESRICMWFDRPQLFHEEVARFLSGLDK